MGHSGPASSYDLLSQRAVGEAEGTLGLEKYFAYRSFPTGAGSTARVNLASGNLVWDLTPVDDPGRGLDSVFPAGLQQPGGRAGPTQYLQRRRDRVLCTGGITRLNQPLDVSLATVTSGDPTITLTDADGTRHQFVQQLPNAYFTAPSGVHLFLRATAAGDSRGAWVATNPQGVSYFFDALGYPTLVVDRNGDQLQMVYDETHRMTGLIDAAGVDDPTIASARTVSLTYYPAVAPDGTLTPAGSIGKLMDITDHAGRVNASDL